MNIRYTYFLSLPWNSFIVLIKNMIHMLENENKFIARELNKYKEKEIFIFSSPCTIHFV